MPTELKNMMRMESAAELSSGLLLRGQRKETPPTGVSLAGLHTRVPRYFHLVSGKELRRHPRTSSEVLRQPATPAPPALPPNPTAQRPTTLEK